MKIWHPVFLCSLAALAVPRSLFADYTVTGRFAYQDLKLDIRGFTGEKPERPIRLADVLIMDTSTGEVLAQGATDRNGDFSIRVVASQSRDVSVIVVANSANTPDLHQAVMSDPPSGSKNGTTPHAFEGGFYSGHSATQNISMGTAVARYRDGGEPFNIYDTMLDHADFIALHIGRWPEEAIKTIINFNLGATGDFAYFSSGAGPAGGVFLGPIYGYDDTIILHELGHYVQRNYGDFSDNPGGTHFIGDNAQNARLSWGEGWPTFWGSHIRQFRGENHPNVYVNTLGDSTPNRISFSYDLELRTGEGASSENAVQSALWDMTDGPDTPDFSPGVDDEPGFQLTRDFFETLVVAAFEMSFITQEQRTFEDFYDTWNTVTPDPQTAVLNDLLFFNHNIRYRADDFEDDDTLSQAYHFSHVEIGSTVNTLRTHYPAGDEDWVVFDGFASVKYRLSTNTMRDGADTFLSVHSATGDQLAANDNIGVPTPGTANAFEALRSEIIYQPPQNGPVYVRCRRSTSNRDSKYGAYNFAIAVTEVGEAAPNIVLSTAAVVLSLKQEEKTERTVIVKNTGTSDTLLYQIQEQQRDGTPFDFTWLLSSRTEGRLPPGVADTVTLQFDATQAGLGQNVARLETLSNDPNAARRPIAVALTVTPGTTVADSRPEVLPLTFALGQSYPNPFFSNGTAAGANRISYDIPEQHAASVPVSLRVYDILGREVRTVVHEMKTAGSHAASWDGNNNFGEPAPNGVYFYRLKAGAFTAVRKLIVVR